MTIRINRLKRREVLKLMGASLALAGAGVACRRPEAKIFPYSRPPKNVVPGVANYFTTLQPRSNGAIGLLVESHEGRPTKIEGNSLNSSSNGAADAYAQASILELYDPDRSRYPTRRNGENRARVAWSDWDAFFGHLSEELVSSKGSELAFLTSGENSPTFLRMKSLIEKRFPYSKWHHYDLLRQENFLKGSRLAFGNKVRASLMLSEAKVILTLQADPFMRGPDSLNASSGFASGRVVSSVENAVNMNRLYSVEAALTVTGSNSDHRLRVSYSDTLDFLKSLAEEIFVKSNLHWPIELGDDRKKQYFLKSIKTSKQFDERFIQSLASDLIRNAGKSVIIVGDSQSPIVHGLAHLINFALSGHGKVFNLYKVEKNKDWSYESSFDSISRLIKSLNKNEVKTLFLLNVNPVYCTPGSLDFVNSMSKAKTVIHAGMYEDETGKLSDWHLPLAHFLETWGDAVSFDGSLGVVQPLIAPLHGSRSEIELLAQVAGQKTTKGDLLVQETLRDDLKVISGDAEWGKILHDGVVENTQYERFAVNELNTATLSNLLSAHQFKSPDSSNLEIAFEQDYSLLDGRLANSGWMQEMPDPITKLTWDNALLVSPFLASKLDIQSRVDKLFYRADVVELSLSGNKITLPVFIMPGLSDFTMITFLGYGRTAAGFIGDNVGVNVYPVFPASVNNFHLGVEIRKLGNNTELASAQNQFAVNGDSVDFDTNFSMQNRFLAREASVSQYVKNPNYVREFGLPSNLKVKNEPVQLTKAWSYTGNKWGMVIDLNLCTGCNACIIACQAENNVPVVGKKQVARGRIMHWIRVDRYFTGSSRNPTVTLQPVNCMHCENAPCEPVCPVAATAHDHEGLNVMVYNRCIGTRYCANNCPYKVRRFNYLDFTNTGDLYVNPVDKKRSKLFKMQRNPNVTVRYRGVMEKCSYCSQRIQEAKARARKENKDPNALLDGSVTPACVQTCPTKAIKFGNLNNVNSEVLKLKGLNRNYDLLEELNIRPRTSYLSKLRNINPELG